MFRATLGSGRIPNRRKGNIGLIHIHLFVDELNDALGNHLAHILARHATFSGIFGLTDQHLCSAILSSVDPD
jgi:hypothetical protein